jgi:deoxycytidylate deaminase
MENIMSLQLAIKIAASLPVMRGQQRICAVVCDKRGRVLSVGVNSYQKSHPIQAKYAEQAWNVCAQYIHAEVAALVALSYNDRQKVHKIFVSRVMKNGETGLAMPCSICQLALKDFGIKEVSYTV